MARGSGACHHEGVGEGFSDPGTLSGRTSGTDRASDRQEIYTVSEAAKVLGITDRRVRALAQEGRIEGERAEGGWKLFRYSVHSFRDERREREAPQGVSGTSENVREWIERTNALQRELGRLEGRLELTERAESTLREDLERERSERQEAQQEARRLREELEAERSKGFWSRLFGG